MRHISIQDAGQRATNGRDGRGDRESECGGRSLNGRVGSGGRQGRRGGVSRGIHDDGHGIVRKCCALNDKTLRDVPGSWMVRKMLDRSWKQLTASNQDLSAHLTPKQLRYAGRKQSGGTSNPPLPRHDHPAASCVLCSPRLREWTSRSRRADGGSPW